jgi:hypothetical protein
MKVGERVTVERLPSGSYRVHIEAHDEVVIGGAATTAIVVANAVFSNEARAIGAVERVLKGSAQECPPS